MKDRHEFALGLLLGAVLGIALADLGSAFAAVALIAAMSYVWWCNRGSA